MPDYIVCWKGFPTHWNSRDRTLYRSRGVSRFVDYAAARRAKRAAIKYWRRPDEREEWKIRRLEVTTDA